METETQTNGDPIMNNTHKPFVAWLRSQKCPKCNAAVRPNPNAGCYQCTKCSFLARKPRSGVTMEDAPGVNRESQAMWDNGRTDEA